MQKINFSFALIPLFLVAAAPMRAQLSVSDLRVEHMSNPLAVDAVRPRLSWISTPRNASIRGERQTAYRIVVASSEANLKARRYDVWDSGRVPSGESSLVSYAGPKLESGQDCWWQVRVWNARGKASAWSRPARWGMGLLNPSDWKARWIEPQQTFEAAPLLRKRFDAEAGVVKAKVFVTAGGYVELYLNGRRVGNDYLVPNLSNYTSRPGLDKYNIVIDNKFTAYRMLYLAYDVTDLLREGRNAVGAVLGNGYYNCHSRKLVDAFGRPCLLCQLELTYADGHKEIVATDETWQSKPSAVVKNDLYDGEAYDARLETSDWARPESSDDGWQAVKTVKGPDGILSAQTSPSDVVTETLAPCSMKRNADGSVTVDFGKEISGWVHLTSLSGRVGDTLKVNYESQYPVPPYTYIYKGTGQEESQPHFSWYVFRSVTIRGAGGIKPEQIRAEAVNTDVPLTAVFHTSDTLFNRINEIWQRSQMDNMHGCTASDCPHRERAPYTGDGQAAALTVMHNFDAAAFYQKWLRDMRDTQNPETGYLPNGAPWEPTCGGGVAWGAAISLVPWEFYVQYGDTTVLRQNFEAMKAQVGNMRRWMTPDGTMLQEMKNFGSDKPMYWLNLGDWCPPGQVPKEELVHTFYLWLCLDHTARAARVLGRTADYEALTAEAEQVKKAFHKKFYDPAHRSYGESGSNIFALRMGVPEEVHKDVVNTLRKEIMEKHSGHLNTGFLATKFFFETLAGEGLNDVAMTVMQKTDFPSFGNWIRQGATTTWEQWNGENSHNHPMFGGGLTWFYRCLAGVRSDEQASGYRHIIVRPQYDFSPDSVYYSNVTPYGPVVSNISKSGSRLSVSVTVPVGSTMTLYLPEGKGIRESGRPLARSRGVKVLPRQAGLLPVLLEQGTYCFEMER